MTTEKLAVHDMQCVGCAGRVRASLLATGGVVKVITSLDDNTAEVTYDEKITNKSSLEDALKKSGFLTTNEHCC